MSLPIKEQPCTTPRLEALGEWAALGFYEGLSLPWPRAYGLAYRRLYEAMPVRILPGRLLVPGEPLPEARTMESHGTWTATALICDFDHNAGLRVNRAIAAAKKEDHPEQAEFIDALVEDLSLRLPRFGGYTHSNPDMRRVVGEGFLAMAAELDTELAAVRRELEHTPDGRAGAEDLRGALNLFLALKDYCAGVSAFHRKALAAVREAARRASGERSRDLSRTAAAFGRAFLHPAETFLEGLLAVHMAWMLDGHDSIGRFDQVLGPLFEADLAAGRLDLPGARRLLDEVWQNFERFNGWNLQIGGTTPQGADGCNRLTEECILACERNRLRRPNVAFRITSKTPDRVVEMALQALANGSGRPALYNDEMYVDSLRAMDLGLTAEDAREIGFGGCTETMIAGLSNVGSLDGYLNLAKTLELALFDGRDPRTGEQLGPHTGAFESFPTWEDFEAALKRQIMATTDAFAGIMSNELKKRFRQGDPKLYRTFFTRDCVRNRKSFEAGGARYNWSVVSYHGIANLIDSVAAIRHLVYEAKSLSHTELIDALQADFVGHERTCEKLKAAPKFGNDLAAADEKGAALVRFAWEELYRHETPRGGRYLPSCILFTTYLGAGQGVGALPDGRRAGEVLTDSVGAAQGRDVHGPTALLKSVAKLPLALAAGTPVLNLRFQNAVLRDDGGLQALAALVRSFFAQGGMQIQISVLDEAQMRAAQREPEKHRDLLVRIGGYSEYFVNLPPELQDSVIARTEHGV